MPFYHGADKRHRAGARRPASFFAKSQAQVVLYLYSVEKRIITHVFLCVLVFAPWLALADSPATGAYYAPGDTGLAPGQTNTVSGSIPGTSPALCPPGGTLNAKGSCDLSYTPLEPIPGVNTSNPNLPQYLSGMYTLSITVGALLAIIVLTWSGIQLMTTESISIETNAKKRIRNALWGLIIVVGSFLIVYTLNPSALTFNFNLQTSIVDNLPQNTTTTAPSSWDQYSSKLEQNLNADHSPTDCADAQKWLADNGISSGGAGNTTQMDQLGCGTRLKGVDTAQCAQLYQQAMDKLTIAQSSSCLSQANK